jgi:hypothetical protein
VDLAAGHPAHAALAITGFGEEVGTEEEEEKEKEKQTRTGEG